MENKADTFPAQEAFRPEDRHQQQTSRRCQATPGPWACGAPVGRGRAPGPLPDCWLRGPSSRGPQSADGAGVQVGRADPWPGHTAHQTAHHAWRLRGHGVQSHLPWSFSKRPQEPSHQQISQASLRAPLKGGKAASHPPLTWKGRCGARRRCSGPCVHWGISVGRGWPREACCSDTSAEG